MKTQMTFSNETEKIKAEIKMLQKKLDFLEELSQTKTPAEIAYKKVYGKYPVKEVSENLTAEDNWNVISWSAFQEGYEQSQKDYKVGEHQEPVKQKDTLYDLLGDFLQYSDHKESVCKIVRDWLDQNTTIVEEDYSTVTLKLKKGAFGDAN